MNSARAKKKKKLEEWIIIIIVGRRQSSTLNHESMLSLFIVSANTYCNYITTYQGHVDFNGYDGYLITPKPRSTGTQQRKPYTNSWSSQ